LQTVFIRNDTDVLKAMNDPKFSWLAQVAKEHNLTPIRTNAETAQPKQMEKARVGRTSEDYDRDIRKYRKQLQIFENKKGSEKAIRDVKSRLALAEKRLQELTLAKDKTSKSESQSEPVYLSNLSSKSEGRLSDEVSTKIIEEIYLRTLSRKPTSLEMETSQKAIAVAETPLNGISDILWAVINTKEFILNH